MKIFTSELLNLSVETMSSVAEDVIDLLQDKSNLSSSYKSVFVIKKNNFMTPFYGWGSTTSMVEPLRGGSLLFATKFQEISGTHFIKPGRMTGSVDLGATQWF